MRFAEGGAFFRVRCDPRAASGALESACWGRSEFAPRKAMPMSDSTEVIVVASKVKAYIKSQGDMKTSSNVLQALSDKIRSLCDEAIETARSDGRKTVLDRDIP